MSAHTTLRAAARPILSASSIGAESAAPARCTRARGFAHHALGRPVPTARRAPCAITECPTRTFHHLASGARSLHSSSAWRRPASSTSSAAAASPAATLKQCSNPACESKPSLPLTALSCPACSSLQPIPSDIDYYSLLLEPSSGSSSGASAAPTPTLKERWHVSPTELKAQWRRKMALTHPDRMGGKDDREQAIAEQQSALINRAYETLTKPLARAVYLLEQNAGASVSEADSLDDASLLMQVMELREQLDDASDEAAVECVRGENATYLEQTLGKIGRLFDSGGEGKMQWEELKKLTIELRYWSNIEDACREWQPGKPITLQH